MMYRDHFVLLLKILPKCHFANFQRNQFWNKNSIPTPETRGARMGTSFRRKNFWDRLDGKALHALMTGQ